MEKATETPWILLIHQIPPKPDYFRVKIWRRLRQVGAVAVKQSVYVLPRTDQTFEDLSWILKEIIEGGGEAFLSEAVFLEGISDDQVKEIFRAARNEDYKKIVEDARSLTRVLSKGSSAAGESVSKTRAQFSRLKKRFEEVSAIDFFSTSGRAAAEGALADAASRLMTGDRELPAPAMSMADMTGRTWVTREGIFVDRAACAWLIRRFIHRDARFKFVAGKTYQPKSDEIRFDMFDAEFTHVGDRCTFEVMIERFGLDDPSVLQLAEIVHDMDLKDHKFERPEAYGVRILFQGMAAARATDEERLERGLVIFDELYQYFAKNLG